MSLHSHKFFNYSTFDPNHPSVNSTFNPDIDCYTSELNSKIFISFSIVNIFILLPLYIFILHHGFHQWGQNLFSFSAAAIKHSDCFTYHTVSMGLVGVFGRFLCFCGFYSNYPVLVSVGSYLYAFTCTGETFFHILMCLEHYLAVVHPITYLSLKKEKGIRIRNISIGCVWLLSITVTCLMYIENVVIIINSLILMVTVTVISFCSLSVLWALIRPGPGKQGRVDKSKKRAFYTTAAILGVLTVRFTWSLVWAAQFIITGKDNCLIMISNLWFNLPSSLVLPVLFLHRTETCLSQKCNILCRKG